MLKTPKDAILFNIAENIVKAVNTAFLL